MQEPIQELTANRMALRKMFKAIADYGREVRLSRQAAGVTTSPIVAEALEVDTKKLTLPRRKYRKRNGNS